MNRNLRRDQAIDALHTLVVGGRLPDNEALRIELLELSRWWQMACNAVQTNREVELMPLEEAEYALEWCIALAGELVAAELAFRDGRAASHSLVGTRTWVWGRFKNLDAGLRSNGLPRRDDQHVRTDIGVRYHHGTGKD